MSLAAFEPKNYYGIKIKASKKRKIRNSDEIRLTALYDKVLAFNAHTPDTQIQTLKMHLIDLGSMRRHAYEQSKIWESDLSDLSADSTFE